MRVLVLTINYAPEPTGFAPRTAALCECLASRDHLVTVVTGFPFAPYWSRWSEYRGKLATRGHRRGVEVVRLSHFIPRRPSSVFQRILMEGSFSLMAGLSLLSWQHRSDWDVILYVGAQPSIAMLARTLSKLQGVPYVVKITDLASKLAAEVGIVRHRWLQRALSAFEYAAYHQASGAIVVSKGFLESLITHSYPPERIQVISNAVDLDTIRPVPSDNGFREIHGLSSDDFVVMFAGSMGVKQGLPGVVEAASILKSECPSVRWILVGDGEQKTKARKFVSDNGLSGCVRFLPFQPEEEMSNMFSSANVLLLPQLPSVKNTVMPGKLLTYLAAGRPVLAAVNPENQTAAVLQEAGGGIIVTPGDPTALAEGVKQLLQADPRKLQIFGQSNRQYAEAHFDRRKTIAGNIAFLEQIADHN